MLGIVARIGILGQKGGKELNDWTHGPSTDSNVNALAYAAGAIATNIRAKLQQASGEGTPTMRRTTDERKRLGQYKINTWTCFLACTKP